MASNSNDKEFSVLFLYADSPSEWNCSQWRCHNPSNALNASGKYKGKLLLLQSMLDWRDRGVRDELTNHSIVVIERNAVNEHVHDLIRYIQGLGTPVILDWDDSYENLGKENPAFAFWKLNKGNLQVPELGEYAHPEIKKLHEEVKFPDQPPLEMLRRALAIADGFCSPSKQIIEDWRKEADDRVYWLPNYASAKWYEPLKVQQKNERIIIGWGGSVSHYDSWWGSGIYKACKSVAKKRPEVLFRIHGNDPRIYAHLPVPEKNKTLVPGVPPEEWPAKLAEFDIGLAPLHGDYDQRRSWIKGLEYSLAAVPWLGTSGVPYQDLIDVLDADDKTRGSGVLVGEPTAKTEQAGADAWEAAMLEAIDDLPARKKAAQEARKVALKKWTSEANIERTVALYRKIAAGARGSPPLPGVYYVKWNIPASAAIMEAG